MQVLKINPVAEMAIDPNRVASAVSRAMTRPQVADQLVANPQQHQGVHCTPALPSESYPDRSSNRLDQRAYSGDFSD